ncbi:hypothetical protein F4823DRAFT_597526 [Ustulina deusta]|nr:hypothetical protein F4823DRAFT_597526 [Ustulina deusta]
MSGLEIAGLVLGTIPLAIKAVQSYRETFYSIKHVKRDLDYMERDLQTEHLRLQNTCEALLEGIVSPVKMHSMIEDPFGPEWKSYVDPLRLRLYTSYDKFEECIVEMSMAAQALKLQLGIEEGSQVNSRDRTSILEAFRRNASFTLKRKEYEGILSKLQASNATLQEFSRVHRELEPDRRRRSQSRVTKLLRGLSRNIHNALCSAITCACTYSHSIGLQLAHRDAIMLPNDVEEKVAQKFDFRITLSTMMANEDGTKENLQLGNKVQLVSYWKSFQLQLIDDDKPIPGPQIPSPSSSFSSSHRPRRVRWALPIRSEAFERPRLLLSAAQAQVPIPVSRETIGKDIEAPPARVLDLCDILRGEPKARAVNCYGYVIDTQRKFVLSPPNHCNDLHKHITLRQVIDRSIFNVPPFGFEEKLQVALALSVSMLHLDGTPWLAQIMTLDDIVFLVGGESPTNQQPYSLYQPFIIKRVPDTSPPNAAIQTQPPTQTVSLVRPINLAVLSLGALLIQIVIGRVDDELEIAYTTNIGSIISKRARGAQFEEEVLVNGGMNYAAAVKWCLDSIYGVAGLQNDRFCQNFYEAVIARLEDDIKAIAPDE